MHSKIREKTRRPYWRYSYSKAIFIIWNFTVKRYLYQRAGQFMRFMTNTSVLPSLMLGFLSIIIAFFISFKPMREESFEELLTKDALLWYIITASFITIVSVFGGRYFYKKQTAEFYSEYSLEGRTFSNNFMYIAYTIWKKCFFILSYSKIFRVFEKLCLDEGKIAHIPELASDKARRKLLREINSLSEFFMTRHNRIQWIDSMILILARDMRIPPRRLSDYLFQFSPDIFVKEVRASLNAMKEIISICGSNNSNNTEKLTQRRLQLASKILDFKTKLKQRCDFQKGLIRYEDLHSSLIGLSISGSGLSNALESYSLGLQDISRENPSGKDKDENKIRDKLSFFFHKRKLYPGHDLHSLLINFCIQQEQYHKDTTSPKKYFRTVHESLVNIISLSPVSSFNTKHPAQQRIRIPNIKNDCDEYLFDQRMKVSQKFIRYLKESVLHYQKQTLKGEKEKLKRIVLVTQGYSGVVNKSILDLTNEIKRLMDVKDQPISPDDQIFRKVLGTIDIHIFIVLGPNELEDDHLTTSRYVLYKFRDNPDITRIVPNSKIVVKMGSLSWLKSRYNQSNCLKFLVSGAEFIQIDNKYPHKIKGKSFIGTGTRFINNEGVYAYQENHLRNYTHIVLAEDYKVFSYSIQDEFSRRSFNSEQLEYTNLYEWSFKRVIVTPSLTCWPLTPPKNNQSRISTIKYMTDSQSFLTHLKLMTNY